MTTDLSAVESAAEKLQAAKAALDAAVIEASRSGHSNRAIGKAAGVSYETVRLLIRKAE